MSELALKRIAENKAKHARGENAHVLNLENCGLTEVPEEVGKLVWLEKLNLAKNQILHIPNFIQNLLKINDLNLGHNQITSIDELKKLQNLRRLTLCNNQIQNVEILCHFLKIQGIDLRNNQIVKIDFVKNLSNLLILYLTNNFVEELSPISNLNKLTTLLLTKNKISNLEPLRRLHSLRKLDVSQNLCIDLSPLLDLIARNLPVFYKPGYGMGKGIFIGDNHWQHPPIEIVKQGNAAILSYFAEREKAQFKNTEIKLILVGNSTAGKTSLSRFLRERNYQSGEPTTHGICNDRWAPEGREMQVNLWDFGGQEYYHATHRLFLSRNAVYTLVWDATTDKGGFCETPVHVENDPEPSTLQLEHFPQAWWLKNIRHYTRESTPPVPVLLVQNKCARDGVQRVSGAFEKPPFNLLPEWLDNHIDLEATAAQLADPQPETRKWQRSFESFEERLLDKLESQLTHYEFPVYCRDIRDEVRRRAEVGENDMPYSDFEAMCRRYDPTLKMDLVEIYLRDITGDILYYNHNLRLRERVFFRPLWACDSIYHILSRQVQAQEGVFGLGWVGEALRCDEKNALDFVELMREFELVFDDTDEAGLPTGQWVAPQYLPEVCGKPEYLRGLKEDNILVHAFTLWFPDFLPKSHLPRFISNWGARAEGRVFWKNGLLFKTENLKILVERTEEFKIRVDIQTGDKVKREAAMKRIFQSFLDLEDGQGFLELEDGSGFLELEDGSGFLQLEGDDPRFAISLDGKHFAEWLAVQEGMQTQARQVKTTFPETSKYIDIQQFAFLKKSEMIAKKVFISYSHKDEDAMRELDKFLGPLERKSDISIWTDRKILPGADWKAAILSNLEDADLTLLLVSANFLDSDFISTEEIPRAIQRMNEHGKHVVPIILNYCLWDMTSLAALQAMPKDGRPIADFPNPAQAWSEVARGILGLLSA